MNTNSNTYTIIYASVMVIIVAFLLAFVSSALKPMQDANVAIHCAPHQFPQIHSNISSAHFY